MTARNAAPGFGDGRDRLIVIGNFDGVHRGHQYLIRRVLDEARRYGLRPAIMTFDPHPAAVLGRGGQPTLTRLERKIELLRELDPELEVLVEPFTEAMARMSPEQFARSVLRERWRARRVVVGSNFRFGYRRQGDLQQLVELGQQLGFAAQALPLLADGGEPISSSRIRRLLGAGEVVRSRSLLGRPYAVEGCVVHGAHLGRRLGFPTANLEGVVEMLPRRGVYSCRVWLLSGSDDAGIGGGPGEGAGLTGGGSNGSGLGDAGSRGEAAICNVGVRPTVRAAATPAAALAASEGSTGEREAAPGLAAGRSSLQPIPSASQVPAPPTGAVGGGANLEPEVAEERIEVHLLRRSVQLYGACLRVAFVERIRDERRFAGLDELRAQIREDVVVAERQLAVSRG